MVLLLFFQNNSLIRGNFRFEWGKVGQVGGGGTVRCYCFQESDL